MSNSNQGITRKFECQVRHQNHIFIYTELTNGQRIITAKIPVESAFKVTTQ